MIRSDIERDYNVVNGVIRSPGKFEGEPVYVPYYWNVYLEGFASSDDGKVLSFTVEPEERWMFPELKGRRVVKLRCDDSGFVWEWTK